MSELITVDAHVSHLKRKTYKAILELSARHPMLDPKDLALMLGSEVGWVRQVMKSDAFKAQRAQLIEELFGPRLKEIQNKMLDTTEALIDAIRQRIANPDAIVSEETLLKATQLLLDRIIPVKNGPATIQPPSQPAQNIKMVFNGISAEDIERARRSALDRGAMITLEPQHHESAIDVDEDGIPTPARVRSNEGLD
jgi:hypothetical protein